MVYYQDELSVSSSLTVEPLSKETPHTVHVTHKPACPTLRFCLERNQVHPIAHYDDMTEAEKQAAYYSCDELADMKQETRRIARWWNGVNESNAEELTVRGMESLVYKQVRLTKKASRRLSAAAVFMEQDMSTDCGDSSIASERNIAMEYIIFSEPALQRALQMGRMDAIEAGISPVVQPDLPVVEQKI